MEERIIAIVANVMNASRDSLGPESSPKTVKEWDSLKHMNLVLAIEDEFGVQFSDQQIARLTNIAAIMEALRELGAG